jgi:uncharacterized protein (TIGR02265 family)
MSNGAQPPQQLIFENAVEGLFLHGLRQHLTPAFKERLRAQGLDLDRPLLPAYPYAVWHRVLHEAVLHVWPELPLEQGYHQLGRQVVLGYRETLIGRALLVMIRALGPRRMLARMEKNLRSADNHVAIQFELVGPQHVRLDVNDCTDHPSYFAGLFEVATELSGGQNVVVTVVRPHPPGGLFEITWE